MCDNDCDPCQIWEEKWRFARKEHTCTGFREVISPGHRYCVTSTLFDGSWANWKHCLRCHGLFKAIAERSRDQSGSHLVAIAPNFGCGMSWRDAFEEDPPPEVVALAFRLPGEE